MAHTILATYPPSSVPKPVTLPPDIAHLLDILARIEQRRQAQQQARLPQEAR